MIVALLLGVWSGAMLLNGGNPLSALARTFDTYFVDAIAEREHAGDYVLLLYNIESSGIRCSIL